MKSNTWVRLVHYDNDPEDLKKILEGYGFAKFNNNDHICLDLSEDEKITISVKLKDGKRVTFAILPRTTNLGTYIGMECIDIRVADQEKQPWVLFTEGHYCYHSAKEKDKIVFGTLLLGDEHYKD